MTPSKVNADHDHLVALGLKWDQRAIVKRGKTRLRYGFIKMRRFTAFMILSTRRVERRVEHLANACPLLVRTDKSIASLEHSMPMNCRADHGRGPVRSDAR